MDDEARSSPLPPLLSGLEQVLALEHSSTGGMTMAEEEDEEDYLPEEEMDDAAARRPPSHHHGDVLPSTWDLSDSWGTTDDQGSSLLVPGVASSSTSGHYKWRPEAPGPYHAAVSSDRRTAHYVGKANHPQDVGTVKADRPLPRDQACFYFEVEVLSTFEDRPTAAMTVGLAAKGFPMHRQPGTWPHSYGYRGLDGRLFTALPPEGVGGGGGGGVSNGSSSGSGTSGSTSTRGKDYGPAFGKGDVIGCGVDFATQEVFYTKNGKYLGVAFHDIFRRSGQQQQQQQQQQQHQSQPGARQGLVRSYLRPYLPNPTMPRRASTTTAAAAVAVPAPPSTSSSSSSGDASAQASSILRSRSRFLPEAAAAQGGGGGGGAGNSGDSAEVSRGGDSTNTTMSHGLAAAAFSRAALRASWLADAGEEEEEQDEGEDMEEEEEEQAGGRESDEQSRRRRVEARQEGGGGGGGVGRSRGRRSASFSAGSSTTASAANRTGVDTLYNTGRAMRQQHQEHQQQQQQQQQQAGSAASSPPDLAVASLPPEVAWDLFPVLSLHGIGESARVNFGQEPFCFDLQAKRAADEAEKERQLAGEGLGLGLEEEEEEVHALIKDYLLVAGYQDTLRCFEAVTSTSASGATTMTLTTAAEQERKVGETGSAGSAMDVVGASAAEEEEQQPGTSSSGYSNGEKNGGEPSALAQSLRGRTERLSSSLTARQELREMLLSGGAVAAIMKRVAKEYPQVWRKCPALRFELHSLAFVDLLRQGALREALVYAQQELVPFALVDTHTPVEAEGGLEGDADQDGSVDMAVGGGNNNSDGQPSDSNGRKKPLRRRRSHSTREVHPGGAAKRRSLAAPEPLSSSSFVSPVLDFAVWLRDVMGLLAYYPNFTGSPVAYLLSQNHREDVADLLNLAILEEEGEGGEGEEKSDREDQGRPLLERALVGLASMHETLRKIKSGGRGEGFRLPALSRAQQV